MLMSRTALIVAFLKQIPDHLEVPIINTRTRKAFNGNLSILPFKTPEIDKS